NASVIGRVTDTGRVRVLDGDRLEVDVPVSHFIDECPTYQIEPEEPAYLAEVRSFEMSRIPDIQAGGGADSLLQLMASPNIGPRPGRRRRYPPEGHEWRHGDLHGLRLAVHVSRSIRRCASRRCRVRPERGLHGCPSAGTHQLPKLRQPGALSGELPAREGRRGDGRCGQHARYPDR